MPDLRWDDFRVILAVARRRSYADAARTLGVNETTVARRVARCEAALGAPLFDRADGRLTPTQAGEEVARRAEKVELEVQSAAEIAAGTSLEVAGTVQITAVPLIANRLLTPRMAGLLGRYPNLITHLIAESADLSLMRRETDIALRLARPRDEPRALVRRIGDVRYGVYTARSLAGQDSAWITYAERMRNLPQYGWVADQIKKDKGRLAGLRVCDAETLLQAIRAGCGKSFLPLWLGESEPDLVRLDDGKTAWSRELWMMLHPDLNTLPRVRIVADWLLEAVRDCLN